MDDKLTQKALVYESNARVSVPTYDGLFSMIQSYFRAQLGEQAASLLVVGAGGGNELSAWGPSNPAWTFTGVDPSEEMLHIAQNKAAQLDLDSRVALIQGTVDDIPASAPKFDAASCILVLHFIDNDLEKLKLLRAIRHHLKPGAPFALASAYGDRESAELQDRIKVWQSFFLDVGYTKAKVDDMGKVIMNISFIPDSRIVQLLQDAGFTHVTRFFSAGLFAGWLCQAE